MHVISLINLAELANVIEPDMYHPGSVSSQDRKFFIHVRMWARMLLAWLTSRFNIQYVCTHEVLKLSIKEFADKYLAYQMVVMGLQKGFYDSMHEASPDLITTKELDRELHGCWLDFSTTLKKEDESEDVLCLSLPSAHCYEVLMKRIPSDMVLGNINGETPSDKEWQNLKIRWWASYRRFWQIAVLRLFADS